MSRVCWAEFAEGCHSPADVQAGLHLFTVVEIDENVAWTASRVARELKPAGAHIGDNDIWIAATALAFGLLLVSRNIRHFARVADLQVVTYQEPDRHRQQVRVAQFTWEACAEKTLAGYRSPVAGGI